MVLQPELGEMAYMATWHKVLMCIWKEKANPYKGQPAGWRQHLSRVGGTSEHGMGLPGLGNRSSNRTRKAPTEQLHLAWGVSA